MSDDIFKDIEKMFEVNQDTIIEFKRLYGFTFVFKTKIITFHDSISSAEIKPLGIIYDEKGEYYFAPLHRSVNISRVVKEYVDTME